MSQPSFNHPELFVPTIPEKKWIVINTDQSDDKTTICYNATKGLMRRVIVLDQDANKLEERFYTGLILTKLFAKITYYASENRSFGEFVFEDCEAPSYVYQRINGTNVLREQWLNGKGEEVAWRHTQNGVLTRQGLVDPAVSIHRPHNLRRDEYWDGGVLQKVCLVDRKTGETVMRQLWVDGKCTSQTVLPHRQNEILEKDLALPLETPASEKEIETPNSAFKIISAQEAREELDDEDSKIQKVLDDFDARRRAGISQGTRTLDLRVDAKLEVKVAEVLQKAGYIVKRSWMTLSSNDGRVPLVVSY